MPTLSADQLNTFMTAIYAAAGAPPDIARTVSESLVTTNLLGHDSHGVIRSKMYVSKIRDGSLQPAARPVIERLSGATAVVDCGWGFGQVGARFAAGVAADLAREYGLGSVALSQVNHIGRLGEYALLLAEQELIGLVMTAGSMVGGSVTPYAGRERRFSTNPMAWAVPVPDGRAPLVLDFATSVVAEGKLQVARSKGLTVPDDWIYDREGHPSTDPSVFYDGGMLRTFGGYKGSGLSMMIEIVATLLSGFAPVSTSGFKLGNPTVMIALQIERFTALEHFEGLVAELIERVKATAPAAGFEEVLVPGEPEARSSAQRVQDGIPLPDAVWQDLVGLAGELGVPVPGGV